MSGFSNPVASAAGTLIRLAMKSVNFVTGVSGWQITRNGNAEFNNVTVRGEVIATGSSGSEIIIDPNNVNPQITFLSPDQTNNAFINISSPAVNNADLGLNSGGFTPGDGFGRRGRLFFADSSDIIDLAIIRSTTQAVFGGLVRLHHDVAQFGYLDTAGSVTHTISYGLSAGADSTEAIHLNVGGVREPWTAATLLNGWTTGGTFVSARFKRVAAPANGVWLMGVMTAGTKTIGTVLFTLPANYHPLATQTLAITQGGSAAGRLDILANGNVTLGTGVGAAGTIEFNGFISTD